jgi:predicted AAA+ superfamily ATPase
MRDTVGNDEESISPLTLAKYRELIDRIFLTADRPAFSCNLRSSVRVGKAPKRHPVDPSLSIAAMGLTPEMLMRDLRKYGFLFEAMCERDLRIYAGVNDGGSFHYRDENRKETDAVI